MPKVVVLCDESAWSRYPHQRDIDRLASFAEVEWVPCQAVPSPDEVVEGVNAMPKSSSAGRGVVAINGGHVGYGSAGEIIAEGDKTAATVAALDGADVVIVAPGGPRITGEMLSQLPQLRMIGDLEGDRFANRVDMEAAFARGIPVVDTTQGTSYPVSEWALALALIALKNAGSDFRRMIGGKQPDARGGNASGTSASELGQEDLWGKDVGLVGCGFMGRRLLDLLRPFQCSVYVYDPYVYPSTRLPCCVSCSFSSLLLCFAEALSLSPKSLLDTKTSVAAIFRLSGTAVACWRSLLGRYLPPEAADMLGFTQTSLERVMTMDVVIALVPQTPATDKLIGE
jgi:phosphoglycerate dehydrogenase-like enzyme|eukprot:COSAG06_NODE_13_length_35352_cov_49.626255_39_plen_341_part_00